MCVLYELLYLYVLFGLIVFVKNWIELYGDFGDWGDFGIWKFNCLVGFFDVGVGFGFFESGCLEFFVFFLLFILVIWNCEVDCVVDMFFVVLFKFNFCFDLLFFFLEDILFILFLFDWYVLCMFVIFFNNVMLWVMYEYVKFLYISYVLNYWI